MKAIAMTVALLCAGCEGDNITRCASGCERGGVRMVKYSAADGCVCSTPTGAETAK